MNYIVMLWYLSFRKLCLYKGYLSRNIPPISIKKYGLEPILVISRYSQIVDLSVSGANIAFVISVTLASPVKGRPEFLLSGEIL